jgi:O-antigen ligase
MNPELITEPETRHYLGEVTFLGDGNDFALSVCFVFPMGLYLYKTTKSKVWRWIYGLALVTLALAVIGTQSRGASLGLGAILLFLWWESRSKLLGTIAIVMLLISALFFAGPSYFTRMSSLTNVHADGSAQGRLDAWAQARYLGLRKNPILGVGAGNFPAWNGGLTAHSIYFLALGELGIPGGVFAVAFVLGNFRRNRRSAKAAKEGSTPNSEEIQFLFLHLAASTVGLGVAGAFLSALYYPHIFILGGLSFAAHAIFTRQRHEQDNGMTALYRDSRSGR